MLLGRACPAFPFKGTTAVLGRGNLIYIPIGILCQGFWCHNIMMTLLHVDICGYVKYSDRREQWQKGLKKH